MARLELPENWQDLASGYILNNLDEEEQKTWEQLVAEYPELANEADGLEESFNALADIVPLEEVPDNLLAKIHKKIEATKIQSQQSSSVNTATAENSLSRNPIAPALSHKDYFKGQWFPGKWQGGRWNKIVWFATVVAIAVLSGQLSVSHRQNRYVQQQLAVAQSEIAILTQELEDTQRQVQLVRPVLQSLQQPGTVTYSLAGSELAQTASGQLVLSMKEEVIIVVQNLPPLSEDKIYRLWADLPQQSGLLYCGQFNSNNQGIIQLTPSSNQCSNTPNQMIITLDGITDPTTSGGPIVLQGAI